MNNPKPIFDNIQYILDFHESNSINSFPLHLQELTDKQLVEYRLTEKYLLSYRGSLSTFNAYRREVEHVLQWTWNIMGKLVKELKNTDFEKFIDFCKNPPKHWIGTKNLSRFVTKNGLREINPDWRPFTTYVSKHQVKLGIEPDPNNFMLSDNTIKDIFAINSSYFNYLIQEEYIYSNPVSLIRQKSRFIRKTHGKQTVRRLSELQWDYLINTIEELANENPEEHERSLFIINLLYGMYLRISELVVSTRWIPKMGDFFQDMDGNWWFTTVGKGNKLRQVSVSNSMLEALKRYRKFRGLCPLPFKGDRDTLIPKIKGVGGVSSTRQIRKIVQFCFDKTIDTMKQEGFIEEAKQLEDATVHWLRHTGISDDIKIRPREHVRDDAGHNSSSITDKYIDVELRERNLSARNKLINHSLSNIPNKD